MVDVEQLIGRTKYNTLFTDQGEYILLSEPKQMQSHNVIYPTGI